MHLPRLKTTERRVGRTEVVHRILPRGEAADGPLEASKRRCEEVSEVEDELGVEGHDNDDMNLLEDDDMMETADTDAPKISLYSIKQRANVAAWESLRPALLTAVPCLKISCAPSVVMTKLHSGASNVVHVCTTAATFSMDGTLVTTSFIQQRSGRYNNYSSFITSRLSLREMMWAKLELYC